VASSSRIKRPKRRAYLLNRQRRTDAAKLVQTGNRTQVFDLQESSSSLPNRQRGKWMWKLNELHAKQITRPLMGLRQAGEANDGR
jgi:hypothetical protein